MRVSIHIHTHIWLNSDYLPPYMLANCNPACIQHPASTSTKCPDPGLYLRPGFYLRI